MAQTHVFPQSGDNNDAANFAQLLGQSNLNGFVEQGLDLINPDYTVPEVTVDAGTCYIDVGSMTSSSTGETRLSTTVLVQLTQTTVSLVDNDVNHIYVDPGLGSDDNGSVSVYTNTSNAGSTELKIGSVDTGTDSITEVNRRPTHELAGLDVDDDITDGGDTIWDSSVSEIPDSALGSIDNSTLTNDSVTVTAGDGLKTGGSVSLGGSVTVDTEPADFAGTFLSDDGADNLTVDLGRGVEDDGSGNIQVDESTAFAFLNTITFEDAYDLDPIPEPPAPSSGTTRVFVDDSDENLKAKDSAGDVVTLMTT